jgi:hypothetical protein
VVSLEHLPSPEALCGAERLCSSRESAATPMLGTGRRDRFEGGRARTNRVRARKKTNCGPFKSPLTDSSRRPPPYHRGLERESRASPGHRGHENLANRRDLPKASDRAWTRLPGLVFPPCSLAALVRCRASRACKRSGCLCPRALTLRLSRCGDQRGLSWQLRGAAPCLAYEGDVRRCVARAICRPSWLAPAVADRPRHALGPPHSGL